MFCFMLSCSVMFDSCNLLDYSLLVAPISRDFLHQEYWGHLLLQMIPWPRQQTCISCVSCTKGVFFNHWTTPWAKLLIADQMIVIYGIIAQKYVIVMKVWPLIILCNWLRTNYVFITISPSTVSMRQIIHLTHWYVQNATSHPSPETFSVLFLHFFQKDNKTFQRSCWSLTAP